MDLAKDDTSCSIDPSDVSVNAGDRVRLAIQLPLADIQQGATGSLEVTGEKQTLQLKIDGLVISASGGALGTGVTEFDREITSGLPRQLRLQRPHRRRLRHPLRRRKDRRLHRELSRGRTPVRPPYARAAIQFSGASAPTLVALS